MTDHDESVVEELRRIARGIGISGTGTLTHTAWGRLFADRVMAEASDEAKHYAVRKYGEVFRSKHFTEERGRVRDLVRQYSRGANATELGEGNGGPSPGVNGNVATLVATQLSFPITMAGEAPRPLFRTHHWILAAARNAIEKKMRGLGQNAAFIGHWERLSAPWPDEPIGTLVSDGRIQADDILRGPEAPESLPETVG